MNHQITINTIEAILLDEALLYYGFPNNVNQQIADRLREKIRDSVAKDLPSLQQAKGGKK